MKYNLFTFEQFNRTRSNNNNLTYRLKKQGCINQKTRKKFNADKKSWTTDVTFYSIFSFVERTQKNLLMIKYFEAVMCKIFPSNNYYVF